MNNLQVVTACSTQLYLVIFFQTMSHSHQLAVKKRNLQRAKQRTLQQQQQLQEQRNLVTAARIYSQHQQAVQQQQQQQPPQQQPQEHPPDETPPHEEDDAAVQPPPRIKKKVKDHHRRIMGFNQQPSTWRKVKSMCNLNTDLDDTPMNPVYPVFKRAKSASAIEAPRSISMQDAHEVTNALLHVLDKKSGEKLIIAKLLRGHTIARLTTDDVSTVVAIADLSESRSTDETADASFQSFPPTSEEEEEVGQPSDTPPPVTTPTESSPPPYQTPSKSTNWDYHLSRIQKGAHLLAKEYLPSQNIPSSSRSILISAPIDPATTSSAQQNPSSDSTPDKCECCMLVENSAGTAAYFALTPENRQNVKCTCGRVKEVQQRQSQEETPQITPQPEVTPTEVAPDTKPIQQRPKTRFGGVRSGIWDRTHTFRPIKKK